jgi:hypothetical protein
MYELEGRFRKGILDPEFVNGKLQEIIESTVNLTFEWEEFYKDMFNIEIDLSQVEIPRVCRGFLRLIIVIPGMTPQILFNKCKDLFQCKRDIWPMTDDNLDTAIISERTADNNPYAIWVRDRINADEKLKLLSADDLKSRGILGITLEERLLYELKFFAETGKHLGTDRLPHTVTLCSGSTNKNGNPITVQSDRDILKVKHDVSENAYKSLRCREVIT